MTIDLASDAADVQAMLVTAVAKYARLHRDRSKAVANPPATRIDLNFWLGDGGPAVPFVMLQFDTRPDASPDGSPTYPAFATLRRPKWRTVINAVVDGELILVTLPDGKPKRMTARNAAKTFGDFFVAILKNARADGTFDPLPKTPVCEIGVEESGGHFGWPAYARRGSVNLVAKHRPRPTAGSADTAARTAIDRAESILSRPSCKGEMLHTLAISKVGSFAAKQPDIVWSFAARWGRSPSAEIRNAVANFLLQPLLAKHFAPVFPLIRRAALHNTRFARTYAHCWLAGQALHPANAMRVQRLGAELRRRS